jgi:dolichol-phosphate mannosyltransferase
MRLLPGIIRTIKRVCIVVVDDSSGQEQAETETMCRKDPHHILYIPRNGKSGRGSAVIDGMRKAADLPSVRVCVEMDADLAHDPHEIPVLLSGLKYSDVVIGSRYMNGSNIIAWPLARLIQSKIINFMLRYWLGLHISDYTNGFRAYSGKACEYLLSVPLREKGFIALSETAYKLKKKGFVISEVPITFTDRKFGTSNADWKELLSSLIGVIRLRFSS